MRVSRATETVRNPHVDDMSFRLRLSGWQVGGGEITKAGTERVSYVALASRPEHDLRAEAATAEGAWAEVCRQAEALGLLGAGAADRDGLL